MLKLEDLRPDTAVRGILPDALVTVVGVEHFGSDALELVYKTPAGKLEAACTGNWFLENHLVIARLDKLSRNDDVQQKLQAPDGRWDLVVCDEAHKMSATVFGNETKYTQRYRLGQLLSGLTRHFLLMTATPHNGKDDDFLLFMAPRVRSRRPRRRSSIRRPPRARSSSCALRGHQIAKCFLGATGWAFPSPWVTSLDTDLLLKGNRHSDRPSQPQVKRSSQKE